MKQILNLMITLTMLWTCYATNNPAYQESDIPNDVLETSRTIPGDSFILVPADTVPDIPGILVSRVTDPLIHKMERVGDFAYQLLSGPCWSKEGIAACAAFKFNYHFERHIFSLVAKTFTDPAANPPGLFKWTGGGITYGHSFPGLKFLDRFSIGLGGFSGPIVEGNRESESGLLAAIQSKRWGSGILGIGGELNFTMVGKEPLWDVSLCLQLRDPGENR